MENPPRKVLLIESDPDNARLLRQMLAEAFGCALDLHLADTLTGALAALRQSSFDLLLLDLALSDGQGLAAVERVSDAAPDTPVVVLTGPDEAAAGMAAIRRGAQDFLVKGMDDPRLGARALRYSLERHRVLALLRGRSRMQALGQLAAGVAHEFNNLLTAIIGNLEVLKALEADEEVTTAALDAAWRAAKLVNNLRAFSKMPSGRPQVIDLREAVSDVAGLMAGSLGGSIEIRLDLPAAPQWVLADRGALEEAAYNLVENARAALSAGGAIAVRTENRPVVAPEAVAPESEAKVYAALVVADSGIGMAPGVLERAFEPFFTTKPIGDAVGLGLSMVLSFARQSSGFRRAQQQIRQGHGGLPGPANHQRTRRPAGFRPGRFPARLTDRYCGQGHSGSAVSGSGS